MSLLWASDGPDPDEDDDGPPGWFEVLMLIVMFLFLWLANTHE